jgi:hypothetical protein
MMGEGGGEDFMDWRGGGGGNDEEYIIISVNFTCRIKQR